jgi:hypothetical protein
MSLTEKIIVDQVNADEFGNVGIRTRTDIARDGEVVSSTYHRAVVGPDDELPAGLPARVVAIVKAARKGALPLPEPPAEPGA